LGILSTTKASFTLRAAGGCWQLPNLQSQIFCRARPHTVIDFPQTANLLDDRLFLIAPDDLFLSANREAANKNPCEEQGSHSPMISHE